MYLIILYISFISFLISILYGKYLGINGTIYFTILCMLFCSLVSVFLFYEVGFLHTVCYVDLVNWINLDLLSIKYSFIFDSLTVVMLFVITTISLFAHIYSIDYMYLEAHLVRFLSYLSLFTFCMIILVTANNLLQLFVGWEGVGICSYFLINFWFLRIQANKAALKALFVNKISDLCLILGMSLIVLLYYSVDYSIICSPLLNYTVFEHALGYSSTATINTICMFLFFGAMGKSAQLGFHVWLPDAMEGPTPVSSLIHAATMVTAGVFLVIRTSFFFEFSTSVALLIIFVSTFTIFFSSTVGMVQNDIKKVIAYSTCSQIGYMLFICGYSGYTAGMFHLFNHAFFKALLFLTAGSIIHASSNEQDVRHMGGLFRLIPFSYVSFFIGSISLMGLPFLTGYYSKDFIMEQSYNFIREFFIVQGHSIFFVRSLYLMSLISIVLTSVYSIRILSLLFVSEFNGFRVFVGKIMDSHLRMNIVLFSLVIFSIFIGFIFHDMMIGFGTDFWRNSVFIYSLSDYEFSSYYIKLLPVLYSLYGMVLCVLFYKWYNLYEWLCSFQVYPLVHTMFYFFNRRWLFDKVYNEYIVYYSMTWLSYSVFFMLFDKGLLDFIGPSGIVNVTYKNVLKVSHLQSGFVYHYAGILLNLLLVFLFLGVVDLEALYYTIYMCIHIGIVY